MLRAGLVQLCSSDDPDANLPVTERLVRESAAGGAGLVLTPEVTNCVSDSRTRQRAVLTTEAEDPTLARLREVAAETGIWLVIGSLALKAEGDERFVNRSFLVAPDGRIAARYDKIHMFDVELGEGESYRESRGFRPGERAVMAATPVAKLGITVCYDLRFPLLYRALAQAGAEVLTIPAAFTVPTGQAHWEVLLRARAIETGCFVLAPAQSGHHEAVEGRRRRTWGHSLAVDPWGNLLADGGEGPGVTLVDLDLERVAAARRSVPSLSGDREFGLETVEAG
jgi:predicted amidohydrolase